MKIKNQYKLSGLIVIKGWYGNQGYAYVNIITDDKGYNKIKENPLQDFIGFGVDKVLRCDFKVYKTEIIDLPDKTITIFYNEPIERIEKGQMPPIEIDFETVEPITVYY